MSLDISCSVPGTWYDSEPVRDLPKLKVPLDEQAESELKWAEKPDVLSVMSEKYAYMQYEIERRLCDAKFQPVSAYRLDRMIKELLGHNIIKPARVMVKGRTGSSYRTAYLLVKL